MSHWPCDGFYDAIKDEIYDLVKFSDSNKPIPLSELIKMVREHMHIDEDIHNSINELLADETLKSEYGKISIK